MVFIVKISLYVYQFPRVFIVNMFLHVIFSRYLHRQCIIHFPGGFILNISLHLYQFPRDFIVSVSLHVYHFPMVFIDNVSFHVYFPVIFIGNLSFHVYHFSRGLHRHYFTCCISFSPWTSSSIFHFMCIDFFVILSSMYHFKCIISPCPPSSMYHFVCIIFPMVFIVASCLSFSMCIASLISFSP